MANTGKSKLKILYLLKILQEETDAQKGLSMKELIERLAEYGISAERKSLYEDIKVLRAFDIDVRTYQRNPVEYAIVRRDFKFDELVLMVDAVQSSRAITDRQANMLITNIKTFASNDERDMLDRRVHVVGRIKTASESVLKTVDAVHEALRERVRVSFLYTKLGADGRRFRTNHERAHCVTPVAIEYDDGFYYLVAWNEEHDGMRTYRLDRMEKVKVCKDEPATRNEETRKYRFEDRDAAVFGRIEGARITAELLAMPGKLEIITDRFGSDAIASIVQDGENSRVSVRVHRSKLFFGWLAGLNKEVRLVGPKSLVAEYNAYLLYLLKDYVGSLPAVADAVWGALDGEPTFLEIDNKALVASCADLECLHADDR